MSGERRRITAYTVSKEKAAELHARRRLYERYRIPYAETEGLMFEHLAMILAGESTLIAKTGNRRAIHLIPRDQDYWPVYDDRLRRIVTYLQEKPRLQESLYRAIARPRYDGLEDGDE